MRKTGKQDKTTEAKEPQVMDPSIREGRVGKPHVNNERVCWAIKTLNEEFWTLFPETPVEYSAPNGRNTMLAVTYDLTNLDGEDQSTAVSLLNLIAGDPHVKDVLVDEGTALVEMVASARTQDRRDSFGLMEAHEVLTDDETEGFFLGGESA
jgi:hypothetical protein